MAKFDPGLLSMGAEGIAASAKDAAERAQQAEEKAEAARKAEIAAKRLKMERQRRLDAITRKKVVKNRMKLYHLIDSGKITRIFDAKAGHVLSDNAHINWGHVEDEDEDPTRFLEDSTEATNTDSDEDSISSKGSSLPEKKKKKSKKEEEEGRRER